MTRITFRRGTAAVAALTLALTAGIALPAAADAGQAGELPTISAPTTTTITERTPVEIPIPVTGDAVIVTASGLPTGLRVSSTSEGHFITGSATRPWSSANWTGSATLTAFTASGSANATWNWSLNVSPRMFGGDLVQLQKGTADYSAFVWAEGTPTPTMTLARSSGDTGGISVTFDSPDRAKLSGGLVTASSGSATFVFSASNGIGDPVEYTLTIEFIPRAVDVTITSPTSTISSGSIVQMTVGEAVAASALTLETTGLPSGLDLEMNGDALRLTGTTSELGTHNVTVTASNSAGRDTGNFTVVVERAQIEVTTSNPEPTAGETITITATGLQPYESVTFTAGAATLGRATSMADGTASVSFAFGSAGRTQLRVTPDSAPSVSGTAVIDVMEHATLSAPDTARLVLNQSGQIPVSVAGYPLPLLVATGLPPGMHVDTTSRTIVGTPTIAGTYTVTLGTTGGSGASPAPITVTVTVGSAPTLDVTTSTLAARSWQSIDTVLGTVASTFPAPTVSATGLPAGLAVSVIDGAIRLTGSTTDLGTHTVTVTAANQFGSQFETVIITVERAEATVTLSTDNPRAGDDVTVTVSGLQPGENAEVWMHSTPVLLARVPAGADGTVTTTVRIPSNAATGSHRIVVVTPNGDTATAALQVLPAAAGLARTGVDALGATTAALMALLAGLLLTQWRRREAR